MGRPTHINHNLPGTAADTTWNLAYNPASQLISQTRSNDAYAWPGAHNVDRPYATNGLNQRTLTGSEEGSLLATPDRQRKLFGSMPSRRILSYNVLRGMPRIGSAGAIAPAVAVSASPINAAS